uniref:Uncharacterized protein n=1 Tax=Rousettus aegyptiacus TaxID=9407 RepID=A0A7J8IP21_ROUAE|nr:hypothetical protein HJG63_010768 [Rousettus aegyptiacus]
MVAQPPAWGPGQPAEGSQVLLIFLMTFTSIRKWFSQKIPRWVTERTGSRACGSKRAWFRFFVLLQGHGSFHGILGFSLLLLGWLCTAVMPVLHLQETLATFPLLPCHLMEEMAHALRSHIYGGNRSPEKGLKIEYRSCQCCSMRRNVGWTDWKYRGETGWARRGSPSQCLPMVKPN